MAVIVEAAVVAGPSTAAAGNDGDVHRPVAEIIEQVLRLRGPVRREGVLDAGTHRIACLGAAVAAGELELASRPEEVHAVVDLAVGQTAGRIEQGAIPGVTDTAAHGA